MNELMILLLENDWLLYGVCGAAAVGCLVQIVLSVIYNRSLNASDRMRSTKLAWLKQMKTRFESGYEWNNRIRNVELFVDKNIGRRKWMGIYLKTWEAIGRMMLPLVLVLSALGAMGAAVYHQDLSSALLYLTYGVLIAVIMHGITVFANIKEKQNLLRTNLCEYFENTLQGEARKRYRTSRYIAEEYSDIVKPREEIACTKAEVTEKRKDLRSENQDESQEGKQADENIIAAKTCEGKQQKKRKEQRLERKQLKAKAKLAKQESRLQKKQAKKAAKEAVRLQQKQEKEKKRVAKLTKRMEKMQQRMGVAATTESFSVNERVGTIREETAKQKREQLKRKVDVTPAQEDQIISEVLREFLA